jgi:hypothetical protein
MRRASYLAALAGKAGQTATPGLRPPRRLFHHTPAFADPPDERVEQSDRTAPSPEQGPARALPPGFTAPPSLAGREPGARAEPAGALTPRAGAHVSPRSAARPVDPLVADILADRPQLTPASPDGLVHPHWPGREPAPAAMPPRDTDAALMPPRDTAGALTPPRLAPAPEGRPPGARVTRGDASFAQASQLSIGTIEVTVVPPLPPAPAAALARPKPPAARASSAWTPPHTAAMTSFGLAQR